MICALHCFPLAAPHLFAADHAQPEAPATSADQEEKVWMVGIFEVERLSRAEE